MISTRWHQEDLIGRLRRQEALGGEKWDALTLPAICEDENDPLGRQVGEALWPERFNASDLEAIRTTIPEHWWNALYMQRPTPPGGAIAKTVWFETVHARPGGANVLRCRFWDCAGRKRGPGLGRIRAGSGPDWTVGALVARLGKMFFIEDIIRVQESSGEVDKLIRKTAERDGVAVRVREEQEPGSAGLAVIESRKATLARFNYRARVARARTVLSYPVRDALEAAGDPAQREKLVSQVVRVASAIPAVVTMERLALGMTTESVEVEEKREFDIEFDNRILADPEAVELAQKLLRIGAGTRLRAIDVVWINFCQVVECCG